jgi:hypothetical protein
VGFLLVPNIAATVAAGFSSDMRGIALLVLLLGEPSLNTSLPQRQPLNTSRRNISSFPTSHVLLVIIIVVVSHCVCTVGTVAYCS